MHMVRAFKASCRMQVMGAPLAGSDVRAYVMTGGGLRLKGLLPRYRSRRVQMIFPLRGTEKRGLVSLEAKRRKVISPSRTLHWSNLLQMVLNESRDRNGQ